MSIALANKTSPQAAFGGHDNTQKIERVYFTITPSGNYVALGDPMDFTTLPSAIPSSTQPPLLVVIQGLAGYNYQYVPNAIPSQSNGKFQVLVAPAGGGPDVDLGAGAYPAGILGDTIIGYADFPRL